VDYRFLLGRDFRVQARTFTVSALCKMNGIDVVRATPCDSEEPMMHLFPAHKVVDYLVYDEEIELKIVSFAR
jgi:hypothetical protein